MTIHTGDFVRVYFEDDMLLYEGYLESFHPWLDGRGAWLEFYRVDGRLCCGIFLPSDTIEVDIPVKI